MGYNTKQRGKLLEYLIENKEQHMNVQKINSCFVNEGINVGTATIYRQLDKLVEQGIVRKYIIDEKTGACYQYIDSENDCHRHFHLKCTRCGKLIHLTCDHLSGLGDHIYEHHGFRVDPSKTVFYGLCADCEGAVQE